MAHTKEPWVWKENADANTFVILSGEKWVVGLIHNGEPLPEQQKENMRRVVACVNACAGISTEQLEFDIAVGGEKEIYQSQEEKIKELKEQINELIYFQRTVLNANPTLVRLLDAEKQRDELLAALKLSTNGLRVVSRWSISEETAAAITTQIIANEVAIAKAEAA